MRVERIGERGDMPLDPRRIRKERIQVEPETAMMS
jgi:hypothetical protein